MSILDFICMGRDNPGAVDAFAALIPPALLPGVRRGELFAIGSLLADYPNGAAVFRLEGERALLLSLFVDRYDRRHGTGSELLAQMEERLRSLGGVYCVELTLPDMPDEPLRAFLLKNGFELERGEEKEALVSLSELKKLRLPKSGLKTVSGEQLEEAVLRRLEAELKARDTYFLEGSLTAPPVMRGLCRYTVEKGAVTAAAIITGEERLSLAFLFGDNSAALSAVLCDAREAVLEKYPPDKQLYINAASESGGRLAKKLLGEQELLARWLARKTI